MKLEELKKLTANYRKEVGIGKPATNREGKVITEQSRSIWFDRHTIEKLLAQTDEKKGGLKIFFAEYGNDYLEESGHDYTGQLTVVLAASNDNEDPTKDEQIENGGQLCPPHCGGDI
ncbi:hypothetical protein KI659_10090 [Litoribacter alkaliphilus]|uniref:Uncharacterized protein n=1 Tax=Litoribacter ruber TaxID=702568 RepID=A0AAP2CIB6_9BACT|nr:hypothetical protein [Litoribacter alkaliphilus]MBS9524365.1 hypothetical protein [Litoribacter alkaliphilus]